MHLLYVCDADGGGIAEYAIRQSAALVQHGAQVSFLCRPSFPVERVTGCRMVARLPAVPSGGSVSRKILDRIRDGRRMARMTVDIAVSSRVDAVLMACYSEYFAPFWAPIYRCLSRIGVPMGTIAHDPVRDYVLGPRWWHRWSVRQGYSYLREVFVHDDTPVDFGGPKPEIIRLHRIPHGPYEVSPPRLGRARMRERFGFGESDQVFLSFGQIRDSKNLDRFLRAMVELPSNVKLFVAGSSAGKSLHQPAEYQQMARELGITDRCNWDIRYIPDEETGDLFASADFVLMTYSAKFHSASGVLNTAVSCRKSVLASSGAGPLKTAVAEYGLGVYIPPDDDAAILVGARHLLATPPEPEWVRYEQENSWDENAKLVIRAFGAGRA